MFLVTLTFVHNSQSISKQMRVLDITGRENNAIVPVWIEDQVRIEALETVTENWYFNNNRIAYLTDTSTEYEYPNPPPLPNINASAEGINSILNLYNVNGIHHGIYTSQDGGNINRSLNIQVFSNPSHKFFESFIY